MKPNDRDLRDRVADQLAEHLHSHGLSNPWADDADTTRTLYSTPAGPNADAYPAGRADFHEELVERADRSGTSTAGDTLTIVFTAGPPGAGKSWVIDRDDRWSGYRQLDADDFKDALLDRALDDGLLEDLRHASFDDGRPVHLRELSAFVHAESLAVFELFRDRCLERNENVVLHGTLTDAASVTPVLERIVQRGYAYEHIEIAVVHATRAAAREGALDRWWQKRIIFADERGGRFVSPRSLDRYFADDGTPKSAVAADQVAADAERFGFTVEVRRFQRDE